VDRLEKLRKWAHFLKKTRAHLDSYGFIEVTTDHLVSAGAIEQSIDCLKVSWRNGAGELHSSPESAMKMLLAETKQSIYQICRCFRDDPTDTGIHRKEFSMLEFYRVSGNYADTLNDTKELFTALANRPLPFTERKLRTCFDSDDLFFKYLIDEVEPSLDPTVPTVLTHFPASVSALAKASRRDNSAERFEIYWQGMEIANGCSEITDFSGLEERLENENQKRTREGKTPHPRPETLISAITMGLPECSGVAIGLDRLFAALNGRSSLQF